MAIVGDRVGRVGRVGRVVLGTGLLLAIPFVAMQGTSEAQWSVFDVALMAVLLLGTGLAHEIAARATTTATYRTARAVALLFAAAATIVHRAATSARTEGAS